MPITKEDLDRLTLIGLLEQALDPLAEESAARPHLRKATESIIAEIGDEDLRNYLSTET